MTSDICRLMAVALIFGGTLTSCEHNYPGPPASRYGDANRATMAAQVVDPDPQYDKLNPPTSGEHAGQAAERYRTDKVKRPARVSASGPQ